MTAGTVVITGGILATVILLCIIAVLCYCRLQVFRGRDSGRGEGVRWKGNRAGLSPALGSPRFPWEIQCASYKERAPISFWSLFIGVSHRRGFCSALLTLHSLVRCVRGSEERFPLPLQRPLPGDQLLLRSRGKKESGYPLLGQSGWL